VPSRADRTVVPRRHDPTLGKYFQDLAEHSVLSVEEEVEQARNLAELEVERWRKMLLEPTLSQEFSRAIRDCLDPDKPDEEPVAGPICERLDELCKRAKRIKPGASSRSRRPTIFERTVDDLAMKLYEADLKRELVDAAHAVVLGGPGSADNAAKERLARLASECTRLERKIQGAKHAFIRANLRLVVSIARRYDKGQMPLIDLIQEGNLGLIKAVERFDYRRGFRFNTYASWWIRHAIGRALADKGHAVRVPVHALDAQQRVGRAMEAISLRLGRTPTQSELSKETGLDRKKLEKIQRNRVAPVASLDKEVSGTDNRRYVDLLADEKAKNPFESTMLAAWERDMEAVLDVLTPMERTIIRWRFGLDSNGEEMTLKEIGDHYSLSRERIRQLQEQALKKLRRKLSLDAA